MTRAIRITITLLIVSALVGGMIALAASAKEPPTELYVRTVPAGAAVIVDGKCVGKSDNLFEVEPGPRKIDVALDGFEPGHKEVTIPSARIKRVVFKLKKQADPPTDNILTNPGAEAGDKTPDAWEQGAAIPGVKYSWDKKVAFEGKASLCIEKTAQRYFPIVSWSQTVERKGDAPSMELSSQVKADKMSKAILDVVFLEKNDKWISHKWASYIGSKKEGRPPADHDWKRYSGKVDIPPGTIKMVVGLQVYGPGKVWFDDVRLEEVKEKAETSSSKKDSPDAMIALVEDFFRHNFRDVTSRKTLEWGDIEKHPNGNRSIRYKYLATFHQNPEKVVVNQIFTFDADGKFVDYKNVEEPQEKDGVNRNKSAAHAKVERRAVGKKVADFPEAVDLSTPESAWAAFHRAYGRMDVEGIAKVVWGKPGPVQFERQERLWKQADPEELAIYNKALLEAECVEVLTYRDDLAAVISHLPFPPGKGRHPYSSRLIIRIDGKWKNLGEDRCPTLEAARAGFEKKKILHWAHFSSIKQEHETDKPKADLVTPVQKPVPLAGRD